MSSSSICKDGRLIGIIGASLVLLLLDGTVIAICSRMDRNNGATFGDTSPTSRPPSRPPPPTPRPTPLPPNNDK